MADNGEKEEEAGREREVERKPDPQPIDHRVKAEPGRTQSANSLVRSGLVLVVAMVDPHQPVGKERAEEARPEEPTRVGDVSEARH